MLGGRGRELLQRLRSLSLELWRDKTGFIGVTLIAALVLYSFEPTLDESPQRACPVALRSTAARF